MTKLHRETIEVNGTATRLLRAGSGSSAVVFLHGGGPGMPFCSGSHVWSTCLHLFAGEGAAVLALDLPGAGGSGLAGEETPTLDRQGEQALAILRQLSVQRCDVIGHAEGGLVALWLAMERPDLVRSVTVTASASAAPAGDLLENLTLAHPPGPPGSREAQGWALRRLSVSATHIDAPLLDACVEAAERAAQRKAAVLAANEMVRAAIVASVMKTKARVFAMSRDSRFPTPVQLIWGDRDPLASVEQGLALYRFVAATQPATFLHILGRTGHFPFRERPEHFHQLVSAFHQSLN